MLTRQDNELLTRVGRGTPMGEFLRRYWVPILMPEELPAPDCAPIRVRVFGEDLVAFRDSAGRPGLVVEACPHRGASLFFGRNEEQGLRCVYHGWKFDTSGACVDMPNEPAESNFKHKIRVTAYPCIEQGNLVWAYLGLPEHQPPLPELENNLLPDDHTFVYKRVLDCNWMQALEGGIDSSHFSFLHRKFVIDDFLGARSTTESLALVASDTHPRFQVVDTDYGVLIGAQRRATEQQEYWRVNIFLTPFYTMAPDSGEDPISRWSAWVPMDDHTTMRYVVEWHPVRPLRDGDLASLKNPERMYLPAEDYLPATSAPGGAFRSRPNLANDFLLDREVQRTQTFSGIKGIGTQDQAVTESMGPIYDRTREHLGTADLGTIGARRWLLNATKALRDQGTEPPGAFQPEVFRVRSAGVLLPSGADWIEGLREYITAVPGVNHPSV